MNTATAEQIASTPVPMGWIILFVLVIVALVALFSWLDEERDVQGNWKRSQFLDGDGVDNWGPLE